MRSDIRKQDNANKAEKAKYEMDVEKMRKMVETVEERAKKDKEDHIKTVEDVVKQVIKNMPQLIQDGKDSKDTTDQNSLKRKSVIDPANANDEQLNEDQDQDNLNVTVDSGVQQPIKIDKELDKLRKKIRNLELQMSKLNIDLGS